MKPRTAKRTQKEFYVKVKELDADERLTVGRRVKGGYYSIRKDSTSTWTLGTPRYQRGYITPANCFCMRRGRPNKLRYV